MCPFAPHERKILKLTIIILTTLGRSCTQKHPSFGVNIINFKDPGPYQKTLLKIEVEVKKIFYIFHTK